jgi:hypothetical protein
MMFPYCRICKRYFDTNGGLRRHFKNKHPNERLP